LHITTPARTKGTLGVTDREAYKTSKTLSIDDPPMLSERSAK